MVSESAIESTTAAKSQRQTNNLEAVTSTEAFESIPVIGKELLSVNAGTPIRFALQHASCIIDSLREMALEGVNNGGISERSAWLMEANLSTAYALLISIERAALLGPSSPQ